MNSDPIFRKDRALESSALCIVLTYARITSVCKDCELKALKLDSQLFP